MPVVNTNQLAMQALHLVNQDIAEGEAIQRVIDNAGISEDTAKELNLHEAIRKMMNRDTEQERTEAEAQLRQQAEEGFTTNVLTEDAGETAAPDENELQQ